MGVWNRFTRLRFRTGLVLSAPIWVVLLWYLSSAYASFDRYRRAVEPDRRIDLEAFHLFLHDEVREDLRALSIRSHPAQKYGLPVYSFWLGNEAHDELLKSSGAAETPYVSGSLRHGGQTFEVRLRLRGNRHWHWIRPQKSLKVKLKQGDLADGAREFNLLNDVSPFGLEETIVADVAQELGILTPKIRWVRVRLNNTDMGVYRYVPRPDEGLLRRNHRMPGNVYSGDVEDLPPQQRPESVFLSTKGWTQVAHYGDKESADDRDLRQLIAAVSDADAVSFASYARAHLDVDKFMAFDALDVIFGGDQHDYFSNHKLYVDPYSGRIEPIVWNSRGFEHPPYFNAIDHPLLIRLKSLPGYLVERDRLVYSLITTRLSPPALTDRIRPQLVALGRDLASDLHWDAFKLLPQVDTFYRQMIRPMDHARWLLKTRSELAQYAQRTHFLRSALEQENIEVTLAALPNNMVYLQSTLGGRTAMEWQSLRLSGDNCPDAAPQSVRADKNHNGTVETSDIPITLTQNAPFRLWTSAKKLIPRQDEPKRGSLRVDFAPQSYGYVIAPPRGCKPKSARVGLRNAITDNALVLHRTIQQKPLAAVGLAATENEGWRASPMPHPFSYPAAMHQDLSWRGDVRLIETTVVDGNLTIAPGSTIHIAADASLIVRGALVALGSTESPIRFNLVDNGPSFVAVLGPSSTHTHLRHVTIQGGHQGREGNTHFPAALNLHHIASASLSNVTLRTRRAGTEALHAAHVGKLRLEDSRFRSMGDNVDIEFSQATITGLRADGSGEDCLDFMGSEVHIRDSVLSSCHDNALSAGEETKVTVQGLVIGSAHVGILAKNASVVVGDRWVLEQAERGLQTKRREFYYAGESSIHAGSVYVVDAEELQKRDKGTSIEVDDQNRGYPHDKDLQYFIRAHLSAPHWDERAARGGP